MIVSAREFVCRRADRTYVCDRAFHGWIMRIDGRWAIRMEDRKGRVTTWFLVSKVEKKRYDLCVFEPEIGSWARDLDWKMRLKFRF